MARFATLDSLRAKSLQASLYYARRRSKRKRLQAAVIWLLATGSWVDTARWDDTAAWNDGE